MSNFRERLQQAAEYAGSGTTQAAIAAALGLNRQTVNRWFLGGEISAENLLDISSKWGVRLEWLRDGDGEMVHKPSSDTLNQEERDLIRSYRSASPQARRVVLGMARAARKSMVTIAAVLPPLLAPSPSDAATSHNLFYAPIASTLHIVRRWLRGLSLRPFAM